MKGFALGLTLKQRWKANHLSIKCKKQQHIHVSLTIFSTLFMSFSDHPCLFFRTSPIPFCRTFLNTCFDCSLVAFASFLCVLESFCKRTKLLSLIPAPKSKYSAQTDTLQYFTIIDWITEFCNIQVWLPEPIKDSNFNFKTHFWQFMFYTCN